jgi:predicted DNA-binding transcriptional regulator AlpA
LNSSSGRVPPRYVRTHDAAAYLGLSGRTLEKHRCTGTGPVFRKLGGRVVYAIEDLEAWAAERARNSTSDPGRKPSSSAAPLSPRTPPRKP